MSLVQVPPCKVPLGVREELHQEMQRLVELDVTEAENNPTDWVSGLVIARKSHESIRICIGP